MRGVGILFLFILLFSINSAIAGPAAPDSFEIVQPDGTAFKAKMYGDERHHWVEEFVSGHVIIRNRESGYWEYAEKLPGGTLRSSGIKVDPLVKNAPGFTPNESKPEIN